MLKSVEAEVAGNVPGVIVDAVNGRCGIRAQRPKTKIAHDLSEMTDLFLDARQSVSDPKPLRTKTVRSYRQALSFFEPALSGAKWEEELPSLVSKLCAERLASGQCSREGINPYLRAINSFFTWCHDLGFLRNRVKIDLLVTERRKRAKTLDDDQIEWWTSVQGASLSELRTKHMALLILDTGVRAEECLAIHDSDLDLRNSRLWIRNGKGGSHREVPLSSNGKAYLRQFIALTGDHRKAGEPGPLFLTSTGRQLLYRNSLRDLKKMATRAGTPWVSWHSFRRTFATQYLRNGGLLTDLQQILGHKDIRTTILYVGDGIDQIVALHDQNSPLARTGKRHQKVRVATPGISRIPLAGRSRKW